MKTDVLKALNVYINNNGYEDTPLMHVINVLHYRFETVQELGYIPGNVTFEDFILTQDNGPLHEDSKELWEDLYLFRGEVAMAAESMPLLDAIIETCEEYDLA